MKTVGPRLACKRHGHFRDPGADQFAETAVHLIFDTWPETIAKPLSDQVVQVLTIPRGGLLTISVLAAAYFASNGVEALREQCASIEALSAQIEEIERKLAAWRKEDEAAKRLMQVPGVGLLTATAAVATVGDAKVFSSGREFAAFLGLVPRQSGTGGRVKLLGISKRGDGYLRRLLIHGARAVITHAKARDPWVEALLARRPLNAVVVALANKMARTIWALLAHGRHYEPRGQALGCA